MADELTSSEAARALQDIHARKDQAINSMGRSRWVDIVFGVLIFVTLASRDFLSENAASAINIAFSVLIVGYVVLGRTRRGAALLGQPTRVRRTAMSRMVRVPLIVLLICVIVAATVLGFVIPELTGTHPHVPYQSTILGAGVGLALIVFGGRFQDCLNYLARGGRRAGSGVSDGQR